MNFSISDDLFSKDKSKTTSNKQQNDNFFGKDLNSRANEEEVPNDGKTTKKTAELYNSDIPWKFSIRYSINYNNNIGQHEITSNSVQISGDVELTPKFTVGINSGYDFKNKGITYTQLRFERDLDSWRLSFNWIPLGNRSTYYFYIGVKASVFSDLKWDKRQVPDKRLF